MRLKVIIPNSGMDRDTLLQREKMLSAFAMPSTEISVECIAHGPESIESAYDEILAGPYVIQQAVEAEKAGFDAVIVYCGSDPAVAAAREILSIPVIGPGKVSKLVAMDISYRYSVLTVLDNCVVRDTEAVWEKGLPADKLASVRSIGIPVSAVRDNMEKTFDALCNAARRCIEEDGAQCIVLSCLGMAGMGERMTNELKIPVIDPAPVAIKYAEMLAGLGICYSRKAYPSPPDKEII